MGLRFFAMSSRRPTLAFLLLAAVGAWLLLVRAPIPVEQVFVTPATAPALRSTASRIAMARNPDTAEEWEVTRSTRFDDDSTKNPEQGLWIGVFLIFSPTFSTSFTRLVKRVDMV